MGAIPPKKIPEEPTPPKVHFEVSVASFNKKTGKWENVPSEIAVKTAAFIKSGGLELFKNVQEGDVLQFTEKSVYKLTEKGWVKAITSKEDKKKLSNIQIISNQIQSKRGSFPAEEITEAHGVSPEFIKQAEQEKSALVMQIKVVGGLEAEIQKLFNDFQKNEKELQNFINRYAASDPEITREILHKYNTLKILTMDAVPKEKTKQEELIKRFQQEKKALDVLVDVIKINEVVEERPFAVITRKLKFLTKGKAKQVFIDENDPKYVYYVAVNSLFQSVIDPKEAELKREVETAKRISTQLLQKQKEQLTALLKQKPDFAGKEEQIVDALLQKYTAEELAKAVENAVDLTGVPGITEQDAKALGRLKKEIVLIMKGGANLVTDLEEVPESERIEGRYTVRAPRAKGNVEELLLEEHTFEQALKYCDASVWGTKALHQSGHVHGDRKPENILVFDDDEAAGADWGKTIELGENEEAFYTGNYRFVSFEGKLSRKGDNYSTALELIKELEQRYLGTEDMLMQPPEIDPSAAPLEHRRGIEKYLILSKNFPHTETASLRGKVTAFSRRSSAIVPVLPSYDPKKAEAELGDYIDVLTTQIENAGDLSPKKAQQLNQLLKQMTRSKPSDRLTSEEVASDWYDFRSKGL